MKTRSMVLEGPRKMRMREFDIPQIGLDEVLLKVAMTGVCGTNPKSYQQICSGVAVFHNGCQIELENGLETELHDEDILTFIPYLHGR